MKPTIFAIVIALKSIIEQWKDTDPVKENQDPMDRRGVTFPMHAIGLKMGYITLRTVIVNDMS